MARKLHLTIELEDSRTIDKLEQKFKDFFNQPLQVSLKHGILLFFMALSIGGLAGMLAPILAWLFIIAFCLMGMWIILPYFISIQEG